jgi:hypothetical protein
MKTRFEKILPTLQNVTFWHLHIGGWLLFWCGDIVIIWLQRIPPGTIIAQALDAPIGFLLGLILRQLYLRMDYKNKSILTLIVFIIFWSAIFALLWHIFMTITRYQFEGYQSMLRMVDWRRNIPWLVNTIPIWFGWSALYFAIKYWKDWDAEKKRSQEADSLAQRAQLLMLRYQVNPHFLFNALNAVRALIDEDKKKAKGMITELSEFLRYSLIIQDHNEVTLQQELEAIQHYLSIEKKRFEDKLNVSFEIDQDSREYPILSFLIHPLIENAVKYGMRTSNIPLQIRIQVSSADGKLRIVISNTGHWIRSISDSEQKSDGTGTGLENVRARLENAYPNRHRFEMLERDGWVEAVLEIHSQPGMK